MASFPVEVRRLLESITIERRSPAYLLVGPNGRLRRTGGNLAKYGLADVDRKRKVIDQVDFLVGLLPIAGGSAILRQITLTSAESVDLYLTAGAAGDWVILLDATRDAAQQAMVQQLGNELALLQARVARSAQGEAGSAAEDATSVLRAQLPVILNVLVLKRAAGRSFRTVGTPPAWFANLLPAVVLEGGEFQPGVRFLFLDSFLDDVAGFWQRKAPGAMSSGIWTEVDPAGIEYHLEAKAVCASVDDVLLIERLDSAYAELRHLLQTGREARLALIERERLAIALAETRDVLEQRVTERTSELARANERLQALSRRQLEVQENERRRIARELHDEIGQLLTAITLNLQLCLKLPGVAPVSGRLEESIELVQRVSQRVRDLSLDLHPPLLDQVGLIAAVRWHVQREAERAGLVASVTTDELESRLDSRIEIACFRVVQEACTNIVRHARALTVGVELRRDATSLELTVRDDGVGFDVAGSRYRASLGLLGMEERVTLAGGRLEIESTPGRGTLVRARFP